MRLDVVSCIVAAVSGVWAFPAAAADSQRFSLRLPGLYSSDFPHGGALKISRQAVRQMEFEIGSPAAERIADGAISVQVNGGPLDPVISHEGRRLSVTVKAGEEPDLIPGDSPARIAIRVRRSPEYDQTWIVDRHEAGFAIETAGNDEGVPVEVHLTAPSPPILIPRNESRTILFKGTVNRKEAIVSVGGEKAILSARPDGSSDFTARASILPNQKDVVVEAAGSKSDVCRMVIPVRRL